MEPLKTQLSSSQLDEPFKSNNEKRENMVGRNSCLNKNVEFELEYPTFYFDLQYYATENGMAPEVILEFSQGLSALRFMIISALLNSF